MLSFHGVMETPTLVFHAPRRILVTTSLSKIFEARIFPTRLRCETSSHSSVPSGSSKESKPELKKDTQLSREHQKRGSPAKAHTSP
ncbi:hypothetical protein HYC85_004147 [Camellia sinensis]|uniref:Uncharacterized protein n=1 Tax=Camellia sinensis TaxID=4442 RepID=A0A7J7HVN6_CAMSI|nr:hypothetical protein HYC85_004147 [Camellia sinensis]